MSDRDRQLPIAGEIFLDHVAHFVPDSRSAAAALARAGFQPTPASVQTNRDASGALVPAGTGNVTAMLQRGYIEVLFQTADTALGRQFAKSVVRHPGLHLIAFSVADAEAAHKHLGAAGFRVQPVAALRRPVATETGSAEAALTVARVVAGEMEEGRIQFLTHHTKDSVWQTRWLQHPNGVHGLLDVVIAVADPNAAAARFARFLGRDSAPLSAGHVFALDRGRVVLLGEDAFRQAFPGISLPALPFIGAYALQVAALDATEAILAAAGHSLARQDETLIAPFPEPLGRGAWVFVEHVDALPWRH